MAVLLNVLRVSESFEDKVVNRKAPKPDPADLSLDEGSRKLFPSVQADLLLTPALLDPLRRFLHWHRAMVTRVSLGGCGHDFFLCRGVAVEDCSQAALA